MDPPPNQQAAQVNLTRALEALSPYLNHPRQTVVRIEAFVLAAVALIFLQLLLGPIRRRSGHWFVQGVLWLAYTAYFPLITYTLGQMVSSPIKNALYPLWALFLFSAAGCTHSIIAYDLEDTKRWKRHLFELIQYLLYVLYTMTLLSPGTNRILSKQVKVKNQQTQPIEIAIWLLLFVLIYANILRLIAEWTVTNSAPSKFVADYMREQAAAIESFNRDPVRMEGYKYLVHWPSGKEKPESFLKDGFFSSNLITIEKIWEMEIDGSLVNSDKGGLGVKDLCLSFALSHLLKRRYFEMECAEANRRETLKFVLEGLLLEKEEDKSYTRAFQIIEVELGFLYDFFFTKYATLFYLGGAYFAITIIKLISIASCGVVLLRKSPTVKIFDPIIEVGTRRVDVIITIVIMASFLAVEVLQLILYVTSDWATVSLACLCIRNGNSKSFMPLNKFIRTFKFTKLPRYWQNKMGQSSVILGSMPNPLLLRWASPPFACSFTGLLFDAMARSMSCLIGLLHSTILSGKTSVQVPDVVRREIVSCMKKYKVDHTLANGKRALRHHGLLEKFSWTLENRSQTSIMLVWHIATEYCRVSFPSEFGWHQIFCGLWTKEKELDKQQVATTLSRYCAYLISSASDLLPGNSTDTLFTFERGLSQGRRLLNRRRPYKDLLQAIIDSECRSNDSRGNGTATKDDNIFVQGLKLGRQLEEEIEDEDVRWRVLAEFWAETIIYIAPSDNAKAHMERLAQGGEFLTHVWALLTHAGILQRGKKETDTPEDIPDTDTPEDIPDGNV